MLSYITIGANNLQHARPTNPVILNRVKDPRFSVPPPGR